MPFGFLVQVDMDNLEFNLFGPKRKEGPLNEWSEMVTEDSEMSLVSLWLWFVSTVVVEGFESLS